MKRRKIKFNQWNQDLDDCLICKEQTKCLLQRVVRQGRNTSLASKAFLQNQADTKSFWQCNRLGCSYLLQCFPTSSFFCRTKPQMQGALFLSTSLILGKVAAEVIGDGSVRREVREESGRKVRDKCGGKRSIGGKLSALVEMPELRMTWSQNLNFSISTVTYDMIIRDHFFSIWVQFSMPQVLFVLMQSGHWFECQDCFKAPWYDLVE